MFKNLHLWLPEYLKQSATRALEGRRNGVPERIFFCICDHFEPYWSGADRHIARKRITKWVHEYPKIAEQYLDDDGLPLKYSFFYPEEEYRRDDMEELAGLCRSGFGEVEIHLHHDNDTGENLHRTLLEYKRRLHGDHGLLARDVNTTEVSYGFIHGNWALDNSRPDGRWCGVNNELTILKETGCFADFTMPSAPDSTQTKRINSIYRAVGIPGHAKSHDYGTEIEIGVRGKGLLLVQGPLALNWSKKKFGVLPGIENGGIAGKNRLVRERVAAWIAYGARIKGLEKWVFIKLHTHGAQEGIARFLFDDSGLQDILEALEESVGCNKEAKLHYVSAREMVNIISAVEAGATDYSSSMRNSRYIWP